VLDAEPQVFQVGINYTDAAKLTGTSAAEQTIRRTPDTGRYLLTDAMATGPAMFDTARLDRAIGVQNSDPDSPTQRRRPAAGAGLRTASLDEVLCISSLDS
ncbi:MAG: glycosyl transferase, partial [Mycobacterium sp.]